MNITPLLQKAHKLPDTPGVYLFKRGSKILYIGKATSLKDRVKSYFNSDLLAVRSPLIEKMIGEARDIDYKQTDSVLEALILESNLIKRYQPVYNTKEKDGKSFSYVVITKEEFPRVFTVRGKELETKHDPDELLYVFGPYTSGSSLIQALKILRKIFPFFGEKDRKPKSSTLKEEIGIVPNRHTIDKKEYAKTIKNIALFFQSKHSQILKNLRIDMNRCAKVREFEKANEIKKKIFALQHINDVALMGGRVRLRQQADGAEGNSIRIEAYDVAHMSGKDMVGVMTVIEDGLPQKSDYRKFNIKSVKESNDTGALAEILRRRFTHDEWTLPALIVLDGGIAQINTAKKVLEEFGYQIPIVSVVKDERHKAKNILGSILYKQKYEMDILLANSEAHRFAINFHRKKRSAF